MSATLFTITYPVVPYYDNKEGEPLHKNPAYGKLHKAVTEIKRRLGYDRPEIRSAALRVATEHGITVEESAPLYVDAVLAQHDREARMSDYSEYYTTYSVWTGTEVKEITGSWYGLVPEPNRYVPGVEYVGVFRVDADAEKTGKHADAIAAWRAEQSRVAALFTEARKLVETVREGVEHLKPLRRDRNCAVVKGRKVPKGSGYRVTYLGDGDYGRFAHLTAPDGKQYKYVSTSNLEREVEDWEVGRYYNVFCKRFKDATCVAIAQDVLRGHAAAWGVLADRLAEVRGDEFGEIFREQVRRYARD